MSEPPTQKPPPYRFRTGRRDGFAFAVAIGATVAAAFVRWLLDPVLGDHIPYATFFAAVAVAAWVGGLRPAVLATGLGAVSALYLVVPPRYSFAAPSGPHAVGLVIYVLVGLGIAGFGEALWRARRRAEDQRERLRTTLASIGDAVIATDGDGRITNLNPVAEALTGWTNAEAKGQPLDAVFQIVNEATRKAVENPATRALSEGIVVGLANHTVLIAKDGTERPIDDSAAPIRCKLGEIVGCVLVFRDVTDRRAAEARVVAERDRVQMVADAVPALISYIGADARYRLNNRAYELWFEHPQGGIVGRHMREVLGEAAWAAVRPHVEAALAGRVVSYEAEVPYRDGGTRWVMATYTPDVGDGGTVRGLVAHVTDITALKRAERQVVTTLESFTDGFVRYDRDWRVVYVNAEGERIHQLTRAEMLGKTVWGLFPAVVGTKLENEFRRAVADHVTIEFENYYAPWDRWYALKGYPTPDGRLTTFIRDITEQRKADALLAGQKRVLEMVAADAPLADVLAALCVVIEEQSPGVLTAILLLDDDRRVRATAGPSLPDGYLGALDALGIDPPYHGPCGSALTTGEAVVVVDAEADERWPAPWRELVREHGLRACRTTPVLAADGTILGTFVVYSRQPGDPAPPDPNVIGVATHLAGLAIERQRHEAELRASEARFRELADVMPQIVYANAADGRMEFVNSRWAEFTGQTRAESADLPAVVHPEDLVALAERWGTAMAAGTPLEAEFRLRRAADGEYRWFLSRSVPIRDATGRVVKWYGTSTDVHDQKRAEQEIARLAAESERQRRLYETVLTNTPDFMYVFSLDHKVVYANDALIRMWGRGHDGAIGKTFLEIGYEPWHAAMHDREIDEVRATMQPVRGEVPFHGTLGRRDYDYIFVPVLGADGGVEAVAGTTRDVTERKATERQLRESEERSAFVRRSSGVGFWYCDLPFDVLQWDELVKAHFHLPPDAAVTIRTFYDRIHPDDREPTRRAIELSIAGRTPYRMDYRTVDPDTGGVTWVRAIGRTFYAGDGTPTRFDGVSLDVTDQKRAEQALRDSETYFRSMADTSPSMLWVTDPTGRCTYISRQWCEYTGTSPERNMGLGWLDCVHPDDRRRAGDVFLKANRQGTPFALDYRFRRHDGEYRWAADTGQPRFDEAGRLIGYIGTVSDIHDRKRAEEELKAADRRKDEFLATLAHELRNPLAPIRNGLQVIKMAGADGTIEQARSMMDRQLTQLVRLVDDLLDVSRVTGGKLELRRGRVELKAVIDAAVETSRPAIEQAGHELAVVVPDAPIFVDGDHTRLAQVVSNLLNNSAKYTHRGGHIRLAVWGEGQTAVVSVTDDGIGIPPAMLDTVFGMFAQVDRTLEKTTGGLGIGLSLVKGLVEMHGGIIEAKSAGEGRGSEFVVRLPVSAAAGVETERPHCTQGHAAPALRRILVVDDNADAADSLGQLLEMLGNEVRTAYDGEAGVAAAGAFRPAVVLCDIGMPKVNGYDAARRIRGEAWGRDMVLVAMTGWGQDDDRRKSSAAGFNHHLVKPVETAAILQLLAALDAAAG